ncbi:hypothetical protein Tco_0773121 [Tanacetum coccineum]|uniref:Tf2-1-like SH3-like domain-containing protein n=1 Tax=Tanacetum coccineum TaxID=301880 RepID=A0ABQ4ZKP8_9ASTR
MMIRGVSLLNSKLEIECYLRYLHGRGWYEFGKKGKLAPQYVGPFEIVEHVGPVAYRLKLPQELSCVHDTFHVSNLKKCLADPDVQVPLDEIEIDENLKELSILGNMKTNSGRNIRISSLKPYLFQVLQSEP